MKIDLKDSVGFLVHENQESFFLKIHYKQKELK